MRALFPKEALLSGGSRRTPFPPEVKLSEGSEGRPSFRRKPKDVRPPEGRASFGKLHLWRFPKEAPEVPEGSNLFLNVLREASPLAAF